MTTPSPGRLYGIGLGPGDPELMTLKAARLIAACPVVAFFAKRGLTGHARRIAAEVIPAGCTELRLEYPVTVEIGHDDPRYVDAMAAFYDDAAARVATVLAAGRDVAVLCEGDPFLYGSFMYLYDRLRADFPCEVVPGITGMAGCWSRAGLPMAHGDDTLSILPGTLDRATLAARLTAADAAVIMKVGRNLVKIRAALGDAGLLDRAVYVERGTMADERVLPFAALTGEAAPYFSLVLVPGRRNRR